LTVDDRRVEAPVGWTILDAARSAGASIPTLCHVEDLPPEATCGICVVEVAGQEGLVPACSTMVKAGMAVQTRSPRVLAARRACVELLLSDHLGDCVAPCAAACPAGIDVPRFIHLLAAGEDQEALAVIRRDTIFAGVLGRVCKRPCEAVCRRALVDEPVAICQLKRFAADRVKGDVPVPRAPDTGRRVAVVGAGPAGLSAAFALRMRGHGCVVYDARPKPGGALRYGLPRYRLPEEVIDSEVGLLAQLGVTFRGRMRLGAEVALPELVADHDAVVLALGAGQALALDVPGAHEGVALGLPFLQAQTSVAGLRVVVVGGGDVGIDAARAAVRRGAGQVTVVCLEPRSEMPATRDQVAAAEAERVAIRDGWGVRRFHATKGSIEAVELVRCTQVRDEQGRLSPAFDEREMEVVACDLAVTAVGQTVEIVAGLGRSSSRALLADPRTLQTNLPGVFVAGDCATGPANVAAAVGAGKRAALSVHQFLRGDRVTGPREDYRHACPTDRAEEAGLEGVQPTPRAAAPELDPRERAHSFDEVALSLEEDDARAEASRCLSCGCVAATDCRLRRYATDLEADGGRYQLEPRKYDVVARGALSFAAHKCIQCRTCVRLSSAMEVAGRGVDTRVRPAEGLEGLDRAQINTLVERCPVGALTTNTGD
jgi:NADPH-dependent glutamate synthase beta subunit-like oxidoreductase